MGETVAPSPRAPGGRRADNRNGEPNQQFPCPNAVAATDQCFNVSVHENYGDDGGDDIANALMKVEAEYLK